MSAQHTPGPWEAHLIKVQRCIHAGTHNGGGPVAYTCAQTTPEIDAANARLIAAAPDLLNALKDCQSFVLTCASGGIFGAEELADMVEELIGKVEFPSEAPNE